MTLTFRKRCEFQYAGRTRLIFDCPTFFWDANASEPGYLFAAPTGWLVGPEGQPARSMPASPCERPTAPSFLLQLSAARLEQGPAGVFVVSGSSF